MIHQHADPPYTGLICAQHFSDDDLTNGKTRNLKKNALPKIFAREESNQNDEADEDSEYIAEIEPNVTNEDEPHSQSYHQLLIEKSTWNLQEQKFKHRIQELEQKVKIQKNEIKFWSQKFNREVIKKESLNNLLGELHAQKLLDEDNFDALKVS